MDAFIDLEDPTDWPATLPHLRELDQLLRCPVCKEYLETPMVVTTCGHTFCSLCLRRCLTQESKCPSCRAPASESELHPNRLVESLIRVFRAGRPQLLLAITQAKDNVAYEGNGRKRVRTGDGQKRRSYGSKDSLSSARKPGTTAVASTDSRRLSGQDDKDVEEIDLVSDSEPHNGDNDLDDMDASGSVASAGAQDSDYQDDSDFIPDNKPKPTTPNRPLQSSDSVACPNCLTHVRQARINWHLDRCLAGKLTEDQPSSISQHTSLGSRSGQTKLQLPAPPSTKNMLPKPTKLAYSLLSEAKLRRTLRELGIPSKGDKHQMQARHIEWINMYMANADSETPVSHRMLLRRLASWEESLNRSSETKTHTLSTPRDMTDHTLKYADSFASLVSQADANRSKNPVQ